MLAVFLVNVCVLSILCFTASDAVINYGMCSSPHNEKGICLHIADCQYLYNMLLSNSLTAMEKKFLKDSQCGYDNTQTSSERRVLVCCPDKHCKDAMTIDAAAAQPGNVLPEAGTCGSVLANRIYGGNVTGIDEFPWMALIEYKKPNDEYGFHCGGSLINSRYILTAAHCVKNAEEQWEVHSVRLGEWNLETNPDCEGDVRGKMECATPHVDVPIERSIVHGDYDPSSKNQYNDIALLRLARSVTYNKYIKPICLPVAEELRTSMFMNTDMDVAGWGLTEKNKPSPVKLKIVVSIWDVSKCHEKYRATQISVNGTQQLCAGGTDGVDTCRGDSGGPLMVMERLGSRAIYFIAGIVSYGPTPCAFQSWPGVYTRVGHHINWIQSNLEA